jgi:thiopurine S-methyltransferase
MKIKYDKTFWDAKYQQNETGWDIGYASTPIKTYINQLKNKNIKILIPGAGNGHEVEYLFKNGFTNITVIDIALQPLKNLQLRLPNFPKENLIHANFFELNNVYDLILEQTFFCALDPILRETYVDKMYNLLTNNGKLVGLLFDIEFDKQGPPFGGSFNEYYNLFKSKFKIITLEKCYNSIKPRAGKEQFFIFEKK